MKTKLYFILPVLLLLILLGVFLNYGPLGLLKKGFPPIEELSFEKVTLEKDKITVEIINSGPDPTIVSQVFVNDAFSNFEISKKTLNHLERATITIVYPWAENAPLIITLLTSDGFTFEKEIPVATLTPVPDASYVTTFALIGLYVGVIPVFLGLLWLPFLRTLSTKWYDFFLSLTIGLLIFLAVDAFEGSFELIVQIPSIFQGVNLILISFSLAFLSLMAISSKASVDVTKKGISHPLKLSYMIALGIGLHNFDEGLAIGGAYSVGKIALGSLLVMGFMIHNVTEGIAIVAPITKNKDENYLKHLILLGLLAGGPTILGAWIGGFAFSALGSLVFLSVGAGAILQVVYEITNYMKKESGEIFTFSNVFGFFLGLAIMYITGLFVI